MSVPVRVKVVAGVLFIVLFFVWFFHRATPSNAQSQLHLNQHKEAQKAR
jgi:hypothetical protein